MINTETLKPPVTQGQKTAETPAATIEAARELVRNLRAKQAPMEAAALKQAEDAKLIVDDANADKAPAA